MELVLNKQKLIEKVDREHLNMNDASENDVKSSENHHWRSDTMIKLAIFVMKSKRKYLYSQLKNYRENNVYLQDWTLNF